MIYLYDETFEGLLTCIYYGYKNYSELNNIQPENIQMDLFQQYEYIDYDEEKSNIIINYLACNFNREFLKSIYTVYLSNNPKKEMTILNTIILGRKYGNNTLQIPNNNIFRFNKIEKNVNYENHRFQGLLRFSEIQNNFLYTSFEPENNILPIIVPHFIERFGNQNFIIHDIKRNNVAIYEDNSIEFFQVENLNIEFSDEEKNYQDLWRIFHSSIAIKERKDKKLQMSNMPKKYWKYLTEMN